MGSFKGSFKKGSIWDTNYRLTGSIWVTKYEGPP